MKSLIARIRTAALVVLATALLALIVDYAFYRQYRRSLRFPKGNPRLQFEREHLPVELLPALGWFADGSGRRDLSRVPFEHPGKVRVLALGDSFTFGDEVAPGFDYPSRLRAQLAAEGLDVEVINLGSSGYGLAQTVRLWEELGRRYRPDFILLGPATLFIERDLTFRSFGIMAPALLHGRYVLDGSELRFVDVAGGEDPRRRFDLYYDLLPPLRYLRFDRTPPTFLRAVIGEGKTMANPFYYLRESPLEERARLYPALLRKISSEAQVFLIHYDGSIVRLADGASDRVAVIPLITGSELGYRRPKFHMSGAGNDQVASMFRQALLGETKIRVDSVDWEPSMERLGPQAIPLDAGAHWSIWYGDQPAARLLTDTPNGEPEDASFHGGGTRALLSIVSPGSSFVREPLFPLAEVPPPDGRVDVVLTGGGRDRVVPLGPLRCVSPTVPICTVHSDVQIVQLGGLVRQAAGDPTPLSHAALRIDGKIVGELEPPTSFAAEPMRKRWVTLAPLGDELMDVARLPASGAVTLRSSDGRVLPLGRFVKHQVPIDWDGRGIHRIIRKGPHGAELVDRP